MAFIFYWIKNKNIARHFILIDALKSQTSWCTIINIWNSRKKCLRSSCLLYYRANFVLFKKIRFKNGKHIFSKIIIKKKKSHGDYRVKIFYGGANTHFLGFRLERKRLCKFISNLIHLVGCSNCTNRSLWPGRRSNINEGLEIILNRSKWLKFLVRNLPWLNAINQR